MTREEAIRILRNIAFQFGSVMREDNMTAIDMAIEALQTELVRCKDCKHHGMSDCPMWEGAITEGYMWCSYGERREE